MSQGSTPAATLAVLLPLVGLALAGCISSSNPTQQALPGLPGVPALPLLGFAQEVLIDGDHRGGEPSIAVDSKNHYYVTAPSGMVSTLFNSAIDPSIAQDQGPQNRQSFIWKSEDQGATWRLLAMTPPPAPPLRGDATFGGADTDVVVDDCDTVYFTDLWLGNVAVSHSDDGGATWTGTQVTGVLPVLDRQWLAPGDACGEVYLLYQTFYAQVWVLRSTDKGMTWPQQVLVIDCNGSPLAQVEGCYNFDGNIIFDKATGSLYFVTGAEDSEGLFIFKSEDDGMTWAKVGDVELPGEMFLIPAIASDAAGNVYAVAAAKGQESLDIYLTKSTDQGATWTEAVPVSPAAEGTEVFPWVAAGDEGKVAIVWYGNNETVDTTDDAEGDWFVFMAASENAHAAEPTWTWAKVSEKPNHKGEICTLGLGCTLPQPVGTRGNRNLLDFFEVAIDKEGRAVAAWSDDYDVSEKFISLPYFGRQVEGIVFAQPAAEDAPEG